MIFCYLQKLRITTSPPALFGGALTTSSILRPATDNLDMGLRPSFGRIESRSGIWRKDRDREKFDFASNLGAEIEKNIYNLNKILNKVFSLLLTLN